MGTATAFATVNYVEFLKPTTIFPSGPLTLGEAAFFMSVSAFAGIIGNFLYLWLLRVVGSRNSILFAGVPQIVRIFINFILSFMILF